MRKFMPPLWVTATSIALSACMQAEKQDAKVVINKNPYPSTYATLPQQKTLITDAIILTGNGERLDNADILFVDGKIVQVGVDIVDEQAQKN